MRALRTIALVLAAAAAGALGAPAAPGAAATTHRCAIVVFTPNSGDGLFDIRARNISCTAARRKLRAARGDPAALRGWSCRRIRVETTGAGRYACRSSVRVHGRTVARLIAYTTGS